MCSRILVAYIILVAIINTFTASAEDTDVSPSEKSDVLTPIIDRSSHLHYHEENHAYKGFWQKKYLWRPRWVKTWQAKKVYVAVWKRMWSPGVFNEWVPIPKPPPGWIKHHESGPVIVNKVPYHH